MQGVPASYCEDHEELRRELSECVRAVPSTLAFADGIFVEYG